MNNEKTYKILFSGGGTGGSVAPLLAIYDEMKNPPNPPASSAGQALYQGGRREGAGGYEFLWLGTKFGVEKVMVEKEGIKFKAISGGKWRRYFSLNNLVDIFKIKLGFFQALFIMLKWRPDMVMSAGSFVSVPVVWAAWLLRVPVLIHQQDVRPGLANKLMAPFAKIITVTFEKSMRDYGKKAVWTGNPIRKNFQFSIFNFQFNKIDKSLPVVLIVGGGTGAMAINRLVEQSFGELTKICQIIHVTGKGKESRDERLEIKNYAQYEFLETEQMAKALKLAEVVVTRAGLGVLSELSYLKKPAIIIPMPESHQEENAAMFKGAAIVLEQKDLTSEIFVTEIKNLINNKDLQKKLGEKMGRVIKEGANRDMVRIILKMLE